MVFELIFISFLILKVINKFIINNNYYVIEIVINEGKLSRWILWYSKIILIL